MPSRNLLTACTLSAILALSACANAPQRTTKLQLEERCVPKDPAAHCVSGEELRRFGALNTEDALRYALFPWIR